MKGLKAKLMSAVAMLTVAAVMLVGTSYAWFTLSTAPEISNIEANLAANENLEIALDNGYDDDAESPTNTVDKASQYEANATNTGPQGSKTGDPYTWGNLVDLTMAFNTINNANNKTQLLITPVKYDANATYKLKYPKYGEDGRVKELDNLNPKYISDFNGKGTNGGVAVYQKETNSKNYDALSITYWLRSNETCKVDLTDNGVKRASSEYDKNAATKDVNGVIGGGSYIEVTADSAGENTQDKVTEYLKHLRIRIDVGNNSYYAIPGTPNGGKYPLNLKNGFASDSTDAQIDLAANTATKATMYVYLDGETISNKDALLDTISNIELNIQFSSNEIGGEGDEPGAMDGATYEPPASPSN